jgi:hypothetical protein
LSGGVLAPSFSWGRWGVGYEHSKAAPSRQSWLECQSHRKAGVSMGDGSIGSIQPTLAKMEFQLCSRCTHAELRSGGGSDTEGNLDWTNSTSLFDHVWQ